MKRFFFCFPILFTITFPVFAGALNKFENGLAVYDTVISGFNKEGDALLEDSADDLTAVGYKLGDSVDVHFANGFYLEAIPFVDGVYVQSGEPMLREFPTDASLRVALNGGNIKKQGNLSKGDKVRISVSKQGGAYRIQFVNSLDCTDRRSDYSSDETFANFREVAIGNIAPGKLYRSSSPADNSMTRGSYADGLAKNAGVKGVLNLQDTLSEIKGRFSRNYKSPYYRSLYEEGNVVGLSLGTDFTSRSFARDITLGIASLVRQRLETPYLVHCDEGKDRSGFTCALLGCLMGASYKEIVNDYMQSYRNYGESVSGNGAGSRYNLMVDNVINEMLFTICRVSTLGELKDADMKKAARDFLEGNGMSGREIDELMVALV